MLNWLIVSYHNSMYGCVLARVYFIQSFAGQSYPFLISYITFFPLKINKTDNSTWYCPLLTVLLIRTDYSFAVIGVCFSIFVSHTLWIGFRISFFSDTTCNIALNALVNASNAHKALELLSIVFKSCFDWAKTSTLRKSVVLFLILLSNKTFKQFCITNHSLHLAYYHNIYSTKFFFE